MSKEHEMATERTKREAGRRIKSLVRRAAMRGVPRVLVQDAGPSHAPRSMVRRVERMGDDAA